MDADQDSALVSRALGYKCVAIGWRGQAPLVISQQRLYHLASGPHSRPEVVKFLPFAMKRTKQGIAQRHLV